MAPMSIWSSFLGVVLCINAQSLKSECYRKFEGRQRVTSPGGGPCGIISADTGHHSCCAVGDQCVEGGLCYFTHPPNPFGHQSGYYIGGCTDPSLNDPSCNRACEDLSVADITFDVKANTWTCCGADADGNVTCNEPTTATVVAKPIVRLATTYVVPSILVTASATGTRPDFANTGSPSIDTSKPESKNSSSGTSLAGPIASGVIGGVALIAIVLGVIFWYRQRRRRAPAQNLPSGAPSGHELPDQGRYYALDKSRQGRTELESVTPHAIEMDGTSRHDRRSIQELP